MTMYEGPYTCNSIRVTIIVIISVYVFEYNPRYDDVCMRLSRTMCFIMRDNAGHWQRPRHPHESGHARGLGSRTKCPDQR